MSAELLEVKSSLRQSQQKEKQSASLVQEFTTMVKEQKTRIAELIKAKREAGTGFKARPLNYIDLIVSFMTLSLVTIIVAYVYIYLFTKHFYPK